MKSKLVRDWDSREKGIEELHSDSKHWLLELNFIKDEIKFLNHLLASNYLDLLGSDHKDQVELLIKGLNQKKLFGKDLVKAIRRHEKILSALIVTQSVTSNTHFLNQHKELQKAISKHLKKYKKIKKSIFRITEDTRRKKKQKKLI